MGILGKKKERTPEQKRLRFRIALGVVAVMAVVCLIPHRKGNKPLTPETIVETMDNQLKDLCERTYGPGCVYEAAERPESVDEPTPDYAKFRSLKKEYDILESMYGESERNDNGRRLALQEQMDSLRVLLTDGRETTTKCFVRRVNVKLPDGREYTGFQKTAQKLGSSELVRMVERHQISEQALKEMENNLKTNE